MIAARVFWGWLQLLALAALCLAGAYYFTARPRPEQAVVLGSGSSQTLLPAANWPAPNSTAHP